MSTYPQEIERRICNRVIQDLLGQGYSLGVNDGEETVVTHCTDQTKIAEAMFSTDEDYLLVYQPGKDRHFGWVRLIYGNGCDVVSDYTINLEPHLEAANKYADSLEA